MTASLVEHPVVMVTYFGANMHKGESSPAYRKLETIAAGFEQHAAEGGASGGSGDEAPWRYRLVLLYQRTSPNREREPFNCTRHVPANVGCAEYTRGDTKRAFGHELALHRRGDAPRRLNIGFWICALWMMDREREGLARRPLWYVEDDVFLPGSWARFLSRYDGALIAAALTRCLTPLLQPPLLPISRLHPCTRCPHDLMTAALRPAKLGGSACAARAIHHQQAAARPQGGQAADAGVAAPHPERLTRLHALACRCRTRAGHSARRRDRHSADTTLHSALDARRAAASAARRRLRQGTALRLAHERPPILRRISSPPSRREGARGDPCADCVPRRALTAKVRVAQLRGGGPGDPVRDQRSRRLVQAATGAIHA